MTQSIESTLGEHGATIELMYKHLLAIETNMKTIELEVRAINLALAERRGERAGLKLAAAIWAFFVSALTTIGGALIFQGWPLTPKN